MNQHPWGLDVLLMSPLTELNIDWLLTELNIDWLMIVLKRLFLFDLTLLSFHVQLSERLCREAKMFYSTFVFFWTHSAAENVGSVMEMSCRLPVLSPWGRHGTLKSWSHFISWRLKCDDVFHSDFVVLFVRNFNLTCPINHRTGGLLSPPPSFSWTPLLPGQPCQGGGWLQTIWGHSISPFSTHLARFLSLPLSLSLPLPLSLSLTHSLPLSLPLPLSPLLPLCAPASSFWEHISDGGRERYSCWGEDLLGNAWKRGNILHPLRLFYPSFIPPSPFITPSSSPLLLPSPSSLLFCPFHSI